MNDLQPTDRRAAPKGASIWTFLIVCLVLAILGLGALGYALYMANSKNFLKGAEAKLKTQQHDLELREGVEQAKLVHARNVQGQVLTQVNTVTNRLMQLLAQCDALRTETAAMRTNAAGRQVGLHPPLVGVARRFYEASLPTLPAETEITTQLEAVRRIGEQVRKNLNTAYQPPADLTNTTQSAVKWSEAAANQVKQLRDALDSLGTEARVKFTRATLTPESPNLAEAMTRLGQQQAGDNLKKVEQTVAAARTSATELRAQANAEKIRADAERDATQTRAKVQEELAAQKRELEEREARLKNELQERDAQLKVAEAKTKVAVETQADEARKVELRKKAAEPAVLAETTTMSKSLPLGQMVITANAADALHPADVLNALRRHARGDLGEVCAADAAENELSITEGFRLLSAYTDRNGVKFWITTEWDRSVTTVMLPADLNQPPPGECSPAAFIIQPGETNHDHLRNHYPTPFDPTRQRCLAVAQNVEMDFQ